jgi:serine/threonine protein kinase
LLLLLLLLLLMMMMMMMMMIRRLLVLARTRTALPTVLQMAPEVLNAERYDARVDVYSFAVMAWEVCSLLPLFAGLSRWDVPAKVSMGELHPECPPEWPAPLCELLDSAWSTDPAQRPTFAQLQQTISSWDGSLLSALWKTS